MYILSTRPFKRLLFLHVKNINCQKRLKHVMLLSFTFFSNLGSFSIFVFIKNVLRLPKHSTLFDLGFILDSVSLNFLKKLFLLFLNGIRYAWMTIFSIEGYHYRAFLTKIKKLKKSVIIFRLGFFYNLMILFSRNIRIYWKKRLFRLRGSNLLELFALSSYIRMVRNLFPYKIKGIIYDNLALNKPEFEKEKFGVKPGKKAKVR